VEFADAHLVDVTHLRGQHRLHTDLLSLKIGLLAVSNADAAAVREYFVLT
jgi:hypothetical protein